MFKFLSAVLIVVAVALAAWVLARYSAATANPPSDAPTRQFAVEGMSCQGCVGAVTDGLEKLPGVRSVKVSLEQKTASVVADPAAVTDAQITAAIAAAGYQGRSLPSAAK